MMMISSFEDCSRLFSKAGIFLLFCFIVFLASIFKLYQYVKPIGRLAQLFYSFSNDNQWKIPFIILIVAEFQWYKPFLKK